MPKRNYYRPESKEFYEAHSPHESALLKLVLQREKMEYTRASFVKEGKFVERYYVEDKNGHHIANECMILDLEIRDGRDTKLALEFDAIVEDLRRYYEQQFE